MVNKPVELLSLKRLDIMIDPSFNGIDQSLHLFDGLIFELELASCALGLTKEATLCSMHLVQLVTVHIVRSICSLGFHANRCFLHGPSRSGSLDSVQGLLLVDAGDGKAGHVFARLDTRIVVLKIDR